MPFPMDQEEEYAVKRVPNPPSAGKWILFGVPIGLLVCTAIAYLWILPDLRSDTGSKQSLTCLTNLGELAKATLLYAADHDDKIPAQGWNETLRPYLKDQPDEDLLFSCPVQRRIDPESSGYAMDSDVAGGKLHSTGASNRTILIFDSRITTPGVVLNPSDTPFPGRHEHGKKNNLVYADGHVASVPAIQPH